MSDPLFTRYTVDIDASPAAVWAMLTDPQLTKQYMFGCEAVTDWRVGSPLQWKGQYEGRDMVFVVGHVVTFEPYTRLAYTTFDPNGTLEDSPRNYVTMTCTLTPRPGGTRLELTQGDFATVDQGAKRFADAKQGGSDILEKMKAVAERLERR